MARDKALELVVITPERQILAATVDSVVVPAHDGELGVLPGRAPLMCELGIGQLRFRKGGETARYFVDGGFAQVFRNTVTVLTERAFSQGEIDRKRIDDAAAAVPPASRTAVEARRKAQRRVSVLRHMNVSH